MLQTYNKLPLSITYFPSSIEYRLSLNLPNKIITPIFYLSGTLLYKKKNMNCNPNKSLFFLVDVNFLKEYSLLSFDCSFLISLLRGVL